MAEKHTPAEHYPLHLKVDTDFSKAFIYMPDGAGGEPKDWTGYSGKAQMRPSAGANSLTLEFSVSLGTDGSVLLAAPAEAIAVPARGVWDLRVIDPDGAPFVLMGGPARITAVVTDDG